MSFIEEVWNKHKDALIDKVFDDAMQGKIVKALKKNFNGTRFFGWNSIKSCSKGFNQ